MLAGGSSGWTASFEPDQKLSEKWDTKTSRGVPQLSAESVPPKALTAERLRELLDYDPKRDRFYWRRSLNSRIRRGVRAGSHGRKSVINIDGQRYSARRLAWLYTTGEWPTKEMAGSGQLREMTRGEIVIARPLSRNNSSGVKGVSWSHKQGKWVAQIGVNYRVFPLGAFLDFRKAVAARKAAEAKYFGLTARRNI